VYTIAITGDSKNFKNKAAIIRISLHDNAKRDDICPAGWHQETHHLLQSVSVISVSSSASHITGDRSQDHEAGLLFITITFPWSESISER